MTADLTSTSLKTNFKTMKKIVLITIGCMISFLSYSQKKENIYHKGWIDFNKNGIEDIFEDPQKPVEERINDLLSQMTIEEKTCQMVTLYGYGRVLKDEMPTPDWKNKLWKDGLANIDEELNSVAYHASAQTQYSYPYSKHAEAINTIQRWFVENTRLGIPVDFTNEGIRGLCHDRATSFPADIGVGSSWDKTLAHQIGTIIGSEAKVLGYTNIYAPILDPARDPRWGRIVESYSEDPFLVAQMGIQVSSGIQQQGVASTLKHYAVYSVPKGGRDGDARTDPHVALREMYNVYLYPFQHVIEAVHPKGVMSSYNDYDGVPISASYLFLTELLRQKFGFNGYVVSDSDAVKFIFSKHHVAKDYKDAVRESVDAGLNVRTTFTQPDVFVNPLRELVKDGEIAESTLNSRVGDVLRVKFELGMFDHPYVENTKDADKIVHSPEHVEISKKASRESLVLLKNDNNILPLDKSKFKSILVTGPNADAIEQSISRYGPSNINVVSVLAGIKKKVSPEVKVDFAPGCHITPDNWPEMELIYTPPTGEEKNMIDEAVSKAKESDLAVVVLGDDRNTVGESFSRTSLQLPGYQEDLLEAIYATGTPVVLVLINGRPMTINWADKYIPAILEAWFPGEYGGDAVADALFGDYNPGGKLTVTFPKTVGQVPLNFPFKPGSQAGQGRNHSRIVGPLYPFGFGLSYTTFEYSGLKITPEKQHPAGNIQVSCDIKNTGKMAGDEIVQLYFHDEVSSVTVYEQQLRGFERVHLDPGETKTITFELTPDDLSLLDQNMNRVVEPGIFEVMVGSSSTDIRLKGDFEMLAE